MFLKEFLSHIKKLTLEPSSVSITSKLSLHSAHSSLDILINKILVHDNLSVEKFRILLLFSNVT